MSTTRSGSFPPKVKAKIRSLSHRWVRKHLSKLRQSLRVTYRGVMAGEMREVVNLHKEWFPIDYAKSYFDSVNNSHECIAAVVNPSEYGDPDRVQSVIVGLIIFEVQPNPDNRYLRFTYAFSRTHSVYITTLGVIEELRGFGIAKELIRQCSAHAQAHAQQPLYLSLHVAAYNEEAIPFYERLGFRRVATLPSHYQIRGRVYDAYFYIYYVANAGPWLPASAAAALRRLFRMPSFIKAVLGVA